MADGQILSVSLLLCGRVRWASPWGWGRMKALAICMSCLMGVFISPDLAHSEDDMKKSHGDLVLYAQKYPQATRRQLKNAWAYDHGRYYEQNSDAHPIGSRSWWFLK